MPNTSSTTIVEISKAANQFRSSIVLQFENKYIDVKSILGLFTTLLQTNSYVLHIHGPDAIEAKAAMEEAFKKNNLEITVILD